MPQQPNDMVIRPSRPDQALSQRPASAAALALPSETAETSMMWPILRNWWLVLLFILIGAGAAWSYLDRTQQLYSSYAKIYIQPTSRDVSEALGQLERENYLSTQLEVIRSTRILDRVSDSPGIRGLKTFLPSFGNPTAYLRDNLELQLERKTDL